MSVEHKDIYQYPYLMYFPKENDLELIQGSVDLINHFSMGKLMLPATVQQYNQLAGEGALVVAQTLEGEVIGSAAYTQFYDKHIWEFGGWSVKEEFQGKGVGTSLLKMLFKKNPHFQTIAFGNSNSGPIFEKYGAKTVNNHAVLPKEVFGPCASCPNKPKVGCCDTIYNLEPLVAKFGMPDYSGYSMRQIDRLVFGFGENQSNKFKGYTKDPSEWY